MTDDQHFNKLFYFCAALSFIGITYLVCLTYFPVPQQNKDFAENVQGFIEGSVVTAALSFLLGGNIPTKKPTSPTVVQTGDAPVNNVTTNPDPNNQPVLP